MYFYAFIYFNKRAHAKVSEKKSALRVVKQNGDSRQKA